MVNWYIIQSCWRLFKSSCNGIGGLRPLDGQFLINWFVRCKFRCRSRFFHDNIANRPNWDLLSIICQSHRSLWSICHYSYISKWLISYILICKIGFLFLIPINPTIKNRFFFADFFWRNGKIRPFLDSTHASLAYSLLNQWIKWLWAECWTEGDIQLKGTKSINLLLILIVLTHRGIVHNLMTNHRVMWFPILVSLDCVRQFFL